MSLSVKTDASDDAQRSRPLHPVPRVRSLHYLRGISALLVFYGHMIVIGLSDGATPKQYWPMIPNLAMPSDNFPYANALLYPEELLDGLGLSVGYLGVCVFFLISGYVILGSLQNISARSFAIGRFFRIWPLLAFVSLVFGSAFSAYIRKKGFETPYSTDDLTMSLLFYWSGNPSIPVIWSLIVEFWFYVIIGTAFFLLKPAKFGFGAVLGLMAGCALFVAVNAGIYHFWPDLPADHVHLYLSMVYLSVHFAFVCLVLIGSGIYIAHVSGRWLGGVLTSLAGLSIFAINKQIFSVTFGPDYMQAFNIGNAVTALLMFVPVLWVDRYIPRIRALKLMGDISYPLYLCHIPLVWILLFYFNQRGFGGMTTLALSTLMILALSYGLHRTIEKPSHELGRWLGRKLDRTPTAARTSDPVETAI